MWLEIWCKYLTNVDIYTFKYVHLNESKLSMFCVNMSSVWITEKKLKEKSKTIKNQRKRGRGNKFLSKLVLLYILWFWFWLWFLKKNNFFDFFSFAFTIFFNFFLLTFLQFTLYSLFVPDSVFLLVLSVVRIHYMNLRIYMWVHTRR